MELSPSIIEWCKYEALGQCLVQWGKDEYEPLSYEQVLEALTSDADNLDLYEEYGIMVWQPFEDENPEWLAKQIASLYDSYICCAEHALKEGK